MLLSVADIVKVPGESIPFAFVVGGGDILDGDEGVQLAGAVRLNGKVANIGEGILELTGTLDAQLDTFCDRCLRPIVVSFEAQLLERFSRTLPENEEEEIYLFENDKLDLKQMVRDSLLLNHAHKASVQRGLFGVVSRLRARSESYEYALFMPG